MEKKIHKIRSRKLKCSDRAELLQELDDILDAIHDDILITDGNGVIVKVSSTFENFYGIARENALGRSVYELEKEGVFSPSITAVVLASGEKVTMSQKNQNNRDIVVTATPVRNEQGTIQKVVSFSRDVTDYLHLQEQYSVLADKVERFEEELDILRSEKVEAEGLVARDKKTQEILCSISRIAPFDTNVLLTGESGVGKSLFAKIIHRQSRRKDGPFIEINCGAIPENLLESELFGYEKGSFTGAAREGKIGLIELAQNGTLFLDEISELSTNLQVKLLKVIQDKKLIRVGGIKEVQVDFRLVTATNKDLSQAMETGAFRDDLYYRLNVISIVIPPLRERKADIIPLVQYFTDTVNQRYGLQKSISHDALSKLLHYPWPGNVRELENFVERILLTTDSNKIKPDHLPGDMLTVETLQTLALLETGSVSLADALETLEREYLKRAYEQCGTTVGVAKLLGISQPSVVRKMKKYRLFGRSDD